jgi:hypothetical protein
MNQRVDGGGELSRRDVPQGWVRVGWLLGGVIWAVLFTLIRYWRSGPIREPLLSWGAGEVETSYAWDGSSLFSW